ncbi:MAG: 50S ribosomal protein L25 [Patescibacteria group bacterium]
MEKITLKAVKRKITGKNVKKLRAQGLLPVSLYGKGLKSQSLELPVKDFLIVYRHVKETGLIELSVADKIHHILIANLHLDPVTRLPLHAEFHAVSLTEKIKAHVLIALIGESSVVKDGTGLLLQTLNEIEVEALPADLPEKIEVDVAGLAAVGAQVLVSDLKLPPKVAVLTAKEEIVVKVVPAVSEEAKKEAEAEAAAAVTKAAEGGEPVESIEGPTPSPKTEPEK